MGALSLRDVDEYWGPECCEVSAARDQSAVELERRHRRVRAMSRDGHVPAMPRLAAAVARLHDNISFAGWRPTAP